MRLPWWKSKLWFIPAIGGSVFGVPFVFREFITVNYYKGKEKLYDKTVVLTGATSGVGQATAKDLAMRGARLILACQDMEACKQVRRDIVLFTRNKFVSCRELNLADQDSIEKFAEEICKSEANVHVLINNAAVMTPERKITVDGIEKQMAVNFFGPFLLTNLLLRKLKESKPSRVLNVSCIDYKTGKLDFDDLNQENFITNKAYKASKLALQIFSYDLALRLQGSGVTVNSVDPGNVDTKLYRNGHKKNLWVRMMNLFAFMVFRNELQGSQTILFGALSPALEQTSGGYYRNCELMESALESKDPNLSARLWLTAEKWTKLTERLKKFHSEVSFARPSITEASPLPVSLTSANIGEPEIQPSKGKRWFGIW